MANETSNTEETHPTQEAVQQTPVTITLQDMQAMVNLIDVASSRGAFRGQELSAVGELYQKITVFLQQVVASQEADEGATATETEEATS